MIKQRESEILEQLYEQLKEDFNCETFEEGENVFFKLKWLIDNIKLLERK